MPKYPQLPRSAYVQRVVTVKQLGPWSNLGISPQNNKDLNQVILQLWCQCGDLSWNRWWVIRQTNLKLKNWVKFDFEVKSPPKHQGSEPRVTAQTSFWLSYGRMDKHKDGGNNNTRRSKMASGKNEQNINGSEQDCNIFMANTLENITCTDLNHWHNQQIM